MTAIIKISELAKNYQVGTETIRALRLFDDNLTEVNGHPTQFEAHLTLLDNSENPLAITLTSTFAIYPVPTHNPIAKELVIPTLFCQASW